MWMHKESKELLPSFFQISLKVLTQQNSLEQWKMIGPNGPQRIKVFLLCCIFLHRLNWCGRPKHPTTPPKFVNHTPTTPTLMILQTLVMWTNYVSWPMCVMCVYVWEEREERREIQVNKYKIEYSRRRKCILTMSITRSHNWLSIK